MAEKLNIQRGSFKLEPDTSITLTLKDGYLFVFFTGAQYSFFYHISYWLGITTIDSEHSGNIDISKEAQSKDVTITNKSSFSQEVVYVFLG